MGHTDRAALIAWAKDKATARRDEALDSMGHSTFRYKVAMDAAAHFDAIAALLEAEAWQPMATAPKDHSFILVFLPGNPRPVQSVQWAQSYEEDTVGFWATPFGPAGRGYTVLIDAPTHWRPLPAPPVREAKP